MSWLDYYQHFFNFPLPFGTVFAVNLPPLEWRYDAIEFTSGMAPSSTKEDCAIQLACPATPWIPVFPGFFYIQVFLFFTKDFLPGV